MARDDQMVMELRLRHKAEKDLALCKKGRTNTS